MNIFPLFFPHIKGKPGTSYMSNACGNGQIHHCVYVLKKEGRKDIQPSVKSSCLSVGMAGTKINVSLFCTNYNALSSSNIVSKIQKR